MRLPEGLRNEFINPSEEFSPIPFWFWNDKLSDDEIIRQINMFKEKGVNGFVIHPRIGLPKDIAFLSEKFLGFIKTAIDEAKKNNMIVFLYDEAMYPSGAAHGLVVKDNPEYGSIGIRVLEYTIDNSMRKNSYEKLKEIRENIEEDKEFIEIISMISCYKSSDNIIQKDSVHILDGEGKLDTDSNTILILVEAFTGGVIRGIHYGEDSRDENAPPYPDILNPKAVEKFIKVVYETFYDNFGDEFGSTVQAIFTDEPHPLGKRRNTIDYKPWTYDFKEYTQRNGLEEKSLVGLWYEFDDQSSRSIRELFMSIIKKRLAEGYYKPIYNWCQNHNIKLTGHPMDSDDIGMCKYFDIPGQDIVLRMVEPHNINTLEGPHSTQAKCSSDSARHLGKRRNINECFGGFGWEFTYDEMMWLLNWLFVRGVNLISPHAFYYSIRGDRKNERPPDVGPHNTWWSDYKKISDYIKRMSWLMTDSVNQAQVAILCKEDYLPWQLPKYLFQTQIEFNYLEQDILTSHLCRIIDGYIVIRQQKYKVVVLDNKFKVNEQTVKKLDEFIKEGGLVINFQDDYVKNNIYASLVVTDKLKCIQVIKDNIDNFFVLDHEEEGLRASHVVKNNTHFILFTNEDKKKLEVNVKFSKIKPVEYWEPLIGRVSEMKLEQSNGIKLELNKAEVGILVCIE